MENEEKAEVGKAILFAIIGTVAFYIIDLILVIPLSYLFALITSFPFLDFVFRFFTWLKDTEYARAISIIAAIASTGAVCWMIQRFCDYKSTEGLSIKILGAILLVINLFCLVINIKGNSPVFANLVAGAIGVFLFVTHDP